MRIIVADDHPIVRKGMRVLLEDEPGWAIVEECADGLAAVESIERLEPDIAIVDIMMPYLNGVEVIRRSSRKSTNTRFLALSMHADESYAVDAFTAGATGYVLKATGTRCLIGAVREVMAGRRYLSPPLSLDRIEQYIQRASDSDKPSDQYELLTEREREVLHLIVQGHTNNQVAERLAISPRTVESHRASLMRKLGLKTSVDLYHFAHKRGIFMHI
jgi:two-component system, NarL family, response regulator NreC